MQPTKPMMIRAPDDVQDALRQLQARLQLQVNGRRVSMADVLRFAVSSAHSRLEAGETITESSPRRRAAATDVR